VHQESNWLGETARPQRLGDDQSNFISSASFTLAAARHHNEDCCFSDRGARLFIVTDGMGGHEGSDVASRVIAESLVDSFFDAPRFLSVGDALSVFNRAFRLAHEELHEIGRHRGLFEMGAAVLIGMRCGGQLYFAGLGDCRMYLLRDGSLRRLTVDDTIPNLLMTPGFISSHEADRHPDRNALVRCLGAEAFEPARLAQVESLRAGDRLLLCTDGLINSVRAIDMEAILAGANCALHAAALLKVAAQAAPARDDTTAIVVSVDEEAPHVALRECEQISPLRLRQRQPDWWQRMHGRSLPTPQHWRFDF